MSIFGSSCEGERSFSILKRIKDYQRSTMGQSRLSALSLLAVESEIMRSLAVDAIISSFAIKNIRKVKLYTRREMVLVDLITHYQLTVHHDNICDL